MKNEPQYEKEKRKTMNPMIEKYLGGAVRALIASGLTALGLFSDSDIEKWAAALAGIVVATAWSWFEKRQARKEKLTAMAMPKKSTESEVKAMVADGQAPSLATPKNEVPVLAIVAPSTGG